MPPKSKNPTNSAAAGKDKQTDKEKIRQLQKKCGALEKEIEKHKKELKEKDAEIERLESISNFCGEGDNLSKQTNNRKEEIRSATPAKNTSGNSKIQDQSQEIERLKEKITALEKENEKVSEDRNLYGKEFYRVCNDIEKKELEIKKQERRRKKQKESESRDSKENRIGENDVIDPKDVIVSVQNGQRGPSLPEPKAMLELRDTIENQREEITELKRLQKELEEEKTKNDKEINDLNQRKLMDEKNKAVDEINSLNNRYEKVNKENTELKTTIDNQKTKIEQLQKTQPLKLENTDRSNNTKSANKRDLEQAESQVKQLQESNEILIEEKNKAVKETDSLKNRFEEVNQENTRLKTTIDSQETKIEQLQKTLSKLENTDRSNDTKSANKRDLEQAESKVKQLQERNEKLLEDKNKAIKEIDSLKNRLSQIAGSKLTDNNPGIADLSDQNRPLKLGEFFSELYDNEWTDALEEMDKKMKNEKQSIQMLLKIVLDAYDFCVKKSESYFNELNGGITKLFKTKELSSVQLKFTKDYRKSMAVHLVTDLEKEFCSGKTSDGEQVTKYRKQCIRVCWFMAVQDPPVFIDKTEEVTGKKFDMDRYKHYTKTGKVADYLVWPILYLHKNGPILGKGVAQGK